jgi:single-stranded-DNA-specific exonuclease
VFAEIKIDAEIDFDAITPKFYRILKQFAPFGPQNMSVRSYEIGQ